ARSARPGYAPAATPRGRRPTRPGGSRSSRLRSHDDPARQRLVAEPLVDGAHRVVTGDHRRLDLAVLVLGGPGDLRTLEGGRDPAPATALEHRSQSVLEPSRICGDLVQ